MQQALKCYQDVLKMEQSNQTDADNQERATTLNNIGALFQCYDLNEFAM
ncbi:unnamed protein product, partial [Rotaria sordida]